MIKFKVKKFVVWLLIGFLLCFSAPIIDYLALPASAFSHSETVSITGNSDRHLNLDLTNKDIAEKQKFVQSEKHNTVSNLKSRPHNCPYKKIAFLLA